jgi:ribosomal protein S30
MNHAETSVGALVKKLRRLTPRLPRKDRDTIIQAVDAILELAVRVHQVEKGPIVNPSRPKVTVVTPEAGS